jgi:hypothetical protein
MLYLNSNQRTLAKLLGKKQVVAIYGFGINSAY